MNKTTICSVVFLDIVEYSKKSVAEQIRLKNQFNALLSLAIRHVPVTDRIILDTGDGASISFLGDPEDALLCAMKLRDAVLAERESPFLLRIGINLGPVRLIRDINKQPNLVGDGINVAQRIMDFAQPNQILVSRSFYDVISSVTDGYAGLFEHLGSRTDKHVREHEIYALKDETGMENAFMASFKHAPALEKQPWWQDKSLLLKKVFPAAAILLVLVALALKMATQPAMRPTPSQPRAAPPKPKSAPAAQSAAAPAALPKSAPAAKAPSRHERKAAADTATLLFRIMPWGEVYVDGKKRGVSPPLKSLEVKAGKHQIEIRNTTLPSHSQTVETHPGEHVIIEHEF